MKNIYFINFTFFLFGLLLVNSTNTLAYNKSDSTELYLQAAIEKASTLCKVNADSAINIIDSAINICNETKSWNEKIRLLRLKGLIYFYKADYGNSLEYTIQSRDLSIKVGNAHGEIFALNNISLVYNEQGFHKKAIEMDKEILNRWKTLKIEKEYAGSYNNIGYGYKLIGNHSLALKFYHLALKHALNSSFDNGIEMYYNNIGNLHLDQNLFDSAKYYFQKGLEVSKRNNNKQIISNSLAYLGEYYIKTKEYKKAVDYLESSLEIAQQLDITYEIEDIAEHLHLAYAKTGNHKKAYTTLMLFKQMADSAKNLEAMQKLTEIEVSSKYEKEKQLQDVIAKNKEIQNELDLRKQKNLRNIGAVLIILMIIWLSLLYSNYKQKIRNNKKLILHRDEILSQKEEIETQRDEIQNLNNTKDKFFAIIAHDLRNPIGATQQLAELLHFEYDTFTQQKIQNFIEHIYKSSIKTSDLLENLLHWAILQTGKIKANQSKFNLTKVIQENIDLLNNNLIQKELNIEFMNCFDCITIADQEMITTVVRNLLQNAIKFSPNKTTITITIDESENFWRISINDQGIGMSIEDQAFIFDMDYDKKKIGKSKEKGTGLGLILCKEFVELNGGIIWVDSILDQGSTFHFTIPIAK